MAAVAGRRVGHRLLVAASAGPRPRSSGACATPSPGRCWWPAPPPRATGSATPCSRRPSTATCCRASGPAHATYARLLADADPDAEDGSASAAELAWHCLASHDLPGGLAALVRAADHAATVFAPSEAFRHLTQAPESWNRVPDAAAVAGVDRVEVLVPGGRGGQPLRRVPAGRPAWPRRPWRPSTRTPSRCGRPWPTTA